MTFTASGSSLDLDELRGLANAAGTAANTAATAAASASTAAASASTAAASASTAATAASTAATAAGLMIVPHGTTGQRPASPALGRSFFDTTLGTPIWYDGTNWISAAGVTV